MSLHPSTRDPAKLRTRQLREQGYADGRAGRTMRWPFDATYKLSYRRGVEARKRDLA